MRVVFGLMSWQFQTCLRISIFYRHIFGDHDFLWNPEYLDITPSERRMSSCTLVLPAIMAFRAFSSQSPSTFAAAWRVADMMGKPYVVGSLEFCLALPDCSLQTWRGPCSLNRNQSDRAIGTRTQHAFFAPENMQHFWAIDGVLKKNEKNYGYQL